jgi:hypothetical protein
VSSLAEAYLEFGLTPAQYHGQLDRLWKALGVTGGPNGEDVFTLAIKAIEQARCKVSSIEGIPDGWELVRVGCPTNGEFYLGMNGQPIICNLVFHGYAYIIIRKIERHKQYRHFANAAEYEPHRDRWIQRSHKHDTKDTPPAGCFRVSSYSDDGVWTIDGKAISYRQMFSEGKTFDDGSPFGVEVTE